MTHQYTKLAEALVEIANSESNLRQDERDSCSEAARILRAADAVDVQGLMALARILAGAAYASAVDDINGAGADATKEAAAETALESALRLALAAREGWQPIETAPEKGPILVVCMNAIHPSVAWGCYRATKAYGGTQVGDWYVGPGASMAATHWMPLPAAPKGTP